MDSFISWIGGKKILRKKIVEQFPEKETFTRYIEVFGGAGWVLFSSDRHAKMEVYNDVNGNLVNLFRCIKYHPNAVQDELQYILISREQFYDAREQIEIRGMTDIQKAARFFILIKESFGADIRSFGLRSRDMQKAKEYLFQVSERLNKVVIENLDFQKLIKNYDKTDAMFYLDPPYYKTEKYYPDRFMPEDHERLKEVLEGLKGKFILSYNDCTYIRNLYSKYNIIEVERVHNLVQKKEKPRFQELIIKNF
ncbi:DNA adenine methylase [Lachnospiraceae bacterium MD308]|nr:DNA adenine methylase [Lachnospiraceae bacterium MD308]